MNVNANLPGAGRAGLVNGADGVLNGFGPAKLDGACYRRTSIKISVLLPIIIFRTLDL
jgi:hypothetical protein